jgi:DMSO/TMAO reductase YedYZ molybdopterin-dependent catalytic subunit
MSDRDAIPSSVRSRRGFLRAAFSAVSAVVVAGCDKLGAAPWFVGLLETGETLTQATQRWILGPDSLAQEFTEADIARPFRSNGTSRPRSAAYDALASNNFVDWRLQVDGLVAAPMRFSLAELKALPSRTQITRHDCVEGWSAIGKWTGVPLHEVLTRVRPDPKARYVVFHCADPMLPNGSQPYYESIDMVDAYHPQTILAYGLNDIELPIGNGAPLRVRVERQLGYKMAKYLMRIELVERFDDLRGGNGGYWEDRGYAWYAGI